ncbi:hypothetical protein BkAM31D_24175 [Halalkalibacter krulwichiae]|uniref:Uncharacterized protein n=2 Tax=Halalkalibacter krulwichiae TaxID=199441 RepID=A0A1X9MK91_9BACI|nr:hypothetical protein BkAM31D_24175 [Halalkalibacter krulwichiae]
MKIENLFLKLINFISILLLPFAIIKRPLKDWIIVYLVSCMGNSFADRFLVSRGYLKYKVRPFPHRVTIHLPFDFLHFPLFLLYYNQWTLHSKPLGIILKLFPFLIPQIIIETIAERRTDLISWKRGWNWQHSIISMACKYLLCRGIIASIRVLNNKETSIT